ncbi:MAG: DEAD/DEAH box helicase [Leptotrichiaceae bacterium]|nr:DEAD/DEAH box helicase [Leptotrichiaceae bacterium]MBP7100360.1 DEAD/DEAH box helicase [Leptotrichiaceae bacterium]MBP7739703.1 DEAD/DEAH box helicase [Leptotrichiaceae bacterium]MBP9630425.1 DEAD/DEAH box helicase [Leptotrichiaceae bacterium]
MANKVTEQLKNKVSEIVFERGTSCFKREEGIINTLLADKKFITIEADYNEKDKNIRTSMTITQKKGEYIESNCSCVDYNQRKNICKHIVALGILSDKTKDVIETIGTENTIMKFDEIFEKIYEISEKEKEIKPKKKIEKNNNLKSEIKKYENGKIENKSKKLNKENEIIEKINIRDENKNLETKKELLLEIEVDEESYSDYRYGYDYERDNFTPGYVFRIKTGIDKTYYVKDVVKFVDSIIKNEKYNITGKFVFNPEIHYFSNENRIIIEEIDKFCKKIIKTDTIIRDKKGLKIIKGFYDKILDVIDINKRIYIFEKYMKKSEDYEPLFIKDNKRIIFREIEQIDEESYYYHFKNEPFKIYKMKQNEREFLNEIGIDREFLNDLLKDSKSGFREKMLLKKIEVAEYTDELGDVELHVQDLNNKNFLQIKISNIVNVIKKDEKYFMPRINTELMEILDIMLEKLSIKGIGIETNDKEYIIDYEGLGVISKIIDENYSDKVKIKLDNTIKKARNINVNFEIKKINNELLDFSFNIDGIATSDVEIVIEGIKNEKTFITLTSGELVRIVNKSIEELLGVVNSVSNLKIGTNKISKIKALQLSQISKNIREDLDEIAEFKKLFKKIKDKKEKDPKNIKVNLFPYQKLGYNWLKNMYDIGFGAILADDMGLGKTLQTIAVINEIYYEKKDFLGLIVVPTSLLHNWKEEFSKFCNIKPILVEGTSKKRRDLISKFKKGLFITTYQSLRNDVEEYKDKKFDIMVLDEAQNIKTSTSQIKKAVVKLNSKVNFALTGTPVENNVMELWSIFDFVLPGYLDTFSKFKRNYKDILINPNSKKIKNLRNIISPFILRRTKKEVLTELPEKFETNVVVQLSEGQKQLYLSYVKKAKKEMSKFNKKENNRMKILAILTKLRQICNSPSLFKEDYDGEIAKIEVLKDLLPDIIENKHRLLVFSQFVGTLKEIEEELINQGIEYFYIDGSVKSMDRMEICKKFNSGEKQVVLISLKAGGTGLNLTGADVVIHYDPWWNIAVENQASDRAHRIGQENYVQVVKLVTEGTIEEKILKIQENKRILSENLLEGKNGEKVLFEMSDDELMGLLS